MVRSVARRAPMRPSTIVPSALTVTLSLSSSSRYTFTKILSPACTDARAARSAAAFGSLAWARACEVNARHSNVTTDGRKRDMKSGER